MTQIDNKTLYRLPWSLNDNVLGWLEPTKRCNLYCEGCYSRNDPKSDKTLEQVREDMRIFTAQRKVDGISIAGGDPLVHPQICEIVRMIREEFGLKVILNTNGLALDRPLLKRLVAAGVSGFTFHIDSTQHRPHWKKATEKQLCALRLEKAQLVRSEGDLSVSFNATITRENLEDVPMLMKWAQDHIDLVESMVFILFRTTEDEKFDYFAGGRPIRTKSLVYYQEKQQGGDHPITADEVLEKARTVYPDFAPAAYLGGTKDPNSVKWLLSVRVGSPRRVLGYLGPRSLELIQTGHHALFGRYLAYTKPSVNRRGRLAALGLSSIDPSARKIAANYAREVKRAPRSLLERQYVQSVLIIQPIDMMASGEMNMCDGCPDMTVHNGELVWSCRLDERQKYGCFLTAAPRKKSASEEKVQVEQGAAE